VVVIRYEGPKGGPGMPEMLTPTSAIMGAGLGKDVALITDGRFSGGSHGFIVGHITPEAQEGGPIALVRTGDFPARSAAEIVANHQNGTSFEPRLMEFEIDIEITVIRVAPVEESVRSVAGSFDRLQKLLGYDLIGIHV
jgi:hypothetical protein